MASQVQKVAELRRLALDQRTLIETSALANVREKHELAAARWDDLADQAERAIAAHMARVRFAPIRRSAASDDPGAKACDPDSPTPERGLARAP